MKPRWKVCGVTDPRTAEVAVEAGADAIGFVFYPPSPRAIEPDAAAVVARALPRETWRVGVFVDSTREQLESAIETVGLDFVQLHGDEPAGLADGLSRHAFKALRLAGDTSPEAALELAGQYSNCTLLVDAAVPGEYGGTGRQAGWEAARALSDRYRLMLAGGLTADNVADAIGRVNPWAIDVSSGLESSPGIKDHELIVRFGETLEALQ
ncbi:MAG: N-(5'-phosphoribosyl)anthranilate isomerase [Acidobacteria bacterium]|nr:N-(5'-phosphoribosyl)anthranilate isomerase [Acidobacteriota bacterium]